MVHLHLTLLHVFSTATAVGLPEEQTASPGVDFTTTTGSVMMADNETVASVSVTILHVC